VSARHLTSRREIFFGCIFLGGICAIFAGGCKHTAPPAGRTLRVDVAGCEAIQRSVEGTICELASGRTLRIALPPVTSAVTVAAEDGRSIERTPSTDDDATFEIRVPEGITAIDVRARVSGEPASARVRVASATNRPWLEEAKAARARGDFARAASVVEAHLEVADTVERSLARGLLARIELARGRAEEAFPLFRQAIDLDRRAGRISEVVDDSFALSFALNQRSQRYTEARAVLDAITEDELALYAEGRVRAPYYRGALAAETGDRRSALGLLRDAQTAARRLRMPRLERNARSALALELQALGRARASLRVLTDLEKEMDVAVREHARDAPTACERAEIANNIGWGAILANDVARTEGRSEIEDARAPLERALSANDCSDVYVREFALSNLARAALDDGDIATARRRLDEAKTIAKEPRGTDRLGWVELEGRILLARGKARDALGVFDDGLLRARAAILHEVEWAFLVARSDALVAAARIPDAIASLRTAEALLDDAMLAVPLGEGRAAYASGRSRSARALVGLLVRQHDVPGAAAVAEHARARVLASALGAAHLERLGTEDRARWEDAVRAFRSARSALDAAAADDWKLPADALARVAAQREARDRELRASLEAAMTLLRSPKLEPPATPAVSRDLELDIFPDQRGFVALAKRLGRVVTYRLPTLDSSGPSAELAAALLDPLAELMECDADSRIVVRAYGAWRTIDVHAFPWRGEPLIATCPVVYSLGLAPPAKLHPRARSLVVGDPTSDLPAALEEARSVARKLQRRFDESGVEASVRLLLRGDATSQAVGDSLREVDRFHYAGHGLFAGEDGWESALPLARGGRLGVPDILALGRAPRRVVVTGCEAAKSGGDTEGLGLAQAFIVAGADEVLAPVRQVEDAVARRFASALYDAQTSLALAARRAALELRAENAASDWTAFRVLVP
jgi:tetratricopeptide (TPR) repeat protein